MFQRAFKLHGLMWVLAGGMPLATVATCDRTESGGSFALKSSNDDLLDDVLDEIDNVFHDDDD